MGDAVSVPQHPGPHSDRIARLVLDSATDFAIISIDLNGNVTSWNPGAEQVLGWTEAEMLGQPACTFFTDADQANGICDQEMAIAARKGRAEDERWHKRKDGSRFWASGLMMRFEAEDSDKQIGFIKILRDRTPQHESEQRLRDSQGQLATALAAGRLGTWQLDLAAKVLTCDAACKANFGRGPDESFSYDDLLASIKPEDRSDVRAAIKHTLDTGEAYAVDYRIIWPDGSEHWIHAQGRVHSGEAGEPIAMVGVTSEITERKRAEALLARHTLALEHAVDERTAALTVSNEELRREIAEHRQTEETLRQAQKMEAVGQLTGGVAHDFNNLLTIIRGSIDLLQRPGIPDDKRQRYIAAISDTVDRATKLTSQLLAFARRQPLNPQVFGLGARFQGIADMLRSTVGSRVTIETSVAPDTWPVLADPMQFDTAMLNLTVNARDAMPEGGHLSFTVGNVGQIPARRGHRITGGEFVAIEVRDNGSGIETALLDRIFEPFFTTKEVGKGTGLGLSQVIGFAKQSGGDIETQSAPGRGTAFTLYLPRSQEPVLEEEASDHEARSEAPSHGCVLIVEDNAQVGEFATEMVQELGYSTEWASSAHMALEMIEAHPNRFDAVFSDVMMPGMNGIELGRHLRQSHPGIPVILTSGYSQVLVQEGSHGFELLHKPYSVDRLSRALSGALARARQPAC